MLGFWFGFLIRARFPVHLLDRLKRVLRGYFGLCWVAIPAHFQGLKTGLNAFCFAFAKLVSTHWGG